MIHSTLNDRIWSHGSEVEALRFMKEASIDSHTCTRIVRDTAIWHTTLIQSSGKAERKDFNLYHQELEAIS